MDSYYSMDSHCGYHLERLPRDILCLPLRLSSPIWSDYDMTSVNDTVMMHKKVYIRLFTLM
jgi:hypothetical protein